MGRSESLLTVHTGLAGGHAARNDGLGDAGVAVDTELATAEHGGGLDLPRVCAAM